MNEQDEESGVVPVTEVPVIAREERSASDAPVTLHEQFSTQPSERGSLNHLRATLTTYGISIALEDESSANEIYLHDDEVRGLYDFLRRYLRIESEEDGWVRIAAQNAADANARLSAMIARAESAEADRDRLQRERDELRAQCDEFLHNGVGGYLSRQNDQIRSALRSLRNDTAALLAELDKGRSCLTNLQCVQRRIEEADEILKEPERS